MTAGPWRPISLHTYDTHILDIDVRSKVSSSLENVQVSVDFTLSHRVPCTSSIHLLRPDGSQVIGETDVNTASGHARADLVLSAGTAELWYPVGYGKQPIYTVEIRVAGPVRLFYRSFRQRFFTTCWQRTANCLIAEGKRLHFDGPRWCRRNFSIRRD